MEKVTYIVPIHEFKKETKKLLERALNSLENVKSDVDDELVFVGPSDLIQEVLIWYSSKNEKSRFKEIGLVPNEGSTDAFTQINEAVKKCHTTYFSVLEFDDAYTPYWNEAAQKYAEAIPASVLIPLNEFIDVNGEFNSYGNEIVWSSNFAQDDNEKVGYVSMECLNTFMDFNVTGALIKTADFIEVGGLKPSLKFAAWYEFLLRTIYNGKLVYVVPKIGYQHTVGREGSYSEISYKEVSPEEGKWLIATAKQEYFFTNDRNRKFGDDIEEVTEETTE